MQRVDGNGHVRNLHTQVIVKDVIGLSSTQNKERVLFENFVPVDHCLYVVDVTDVVCFIPLKT